MRCRHRGIEAEVGRGPDGPDRCARGVASRRSARVHGRPGGRSRPRRAALDQGVRRRSRVAGGTSSGRRRTGRAGVRCPCRPDPAHGARRSQNRRLLGFVRTRRGPRGELGVCRPARGCASEVAEGAGGAPRRCPQPAAGALGGGPHRSAGGREGASAPRGVRAADRVLVTRRRTRGSPRVRAARGVHLARTHARRRRRLAVGPRREFRLRGRRRRARRSALTSATWRRR